MNRPRILCVHDAAEKLRALRGTLEDAGYDVEPAENGDTALKILCSERIDGVVLESDLEAPGGVSLRFRIKHLCPELPMLIFNDIGAVKRVPLQAFRAYLEHPGPPESLLSRN
jgi:DNA-binding NtrC family response regulator